MEVLHVRLLIGAALLPYARAARVRFPAIYVPRVARRFRGLRSACDGLRGRRRCCETSRRWGASFETRACAGIVYQAVAVRRRWRRWPHLAWRNAVANMAARGIPMGFGFWDHTAGFDINQSLIPYSALSTYGRAFWVGLLNTLLVGAISIALATPLGFLVGVARLSPNYLLSRHRAGLCRVDAQHAAAAATAISGTMRC